MDISTYFFICPLNARILSRFLYFFFSGTHTQYKCGVTEGPGWCVHVQWALELYVAVGN